MKVILVTALCFLTGCLARPHLEVQSFVFAPPTPSTPKVQPGNHVLGIRSVQVAAPFQDRAFVYRSAEFSYDRDPYAEFMVSPAEALLSPIRSLWRETGRFHDVVDAASVAKPDTLVEIYVDELYGDFRQSEGATAVLAMHFVFFDAPDGVPTKVLLQRSYSRNIPLKARTASALIEGWNQALAQILDLTAQDFGQFDLRKIRN